MTAATKAPTMISRDAELRFGGEAGKEGHACTIYTDTRGLRCGARRQDPRLPEVLKKSFDSKDDSA
jgi:hypothetical protein